MISKRKAVNPVKASPAPPLDPGDFTRQFADAARAAGFTQELFGEIDGHPLFAYTRRTPGPRPRIYLSAGIHADEPAPPWALWQLVRSAFFDASCTWFICPLLNPTGFLKGTRENKDGVDLNRDYKDTLTIEVRAHVRWLQRQPNFDLVLCLHEDWESGGFYLYELNARARPSLASFVINAARELGPIESAAIIDGRPADEPGIIRPVSDPLLRETWPEAIYLHHHHGSLGYTFETASVQPLAQRISTQVAAVKIAVEKLGHIN